MPRSILALTVFLVVALPSFGCGSGGGSPPPGPPQPSTEPTVATVVPNRGPTSGSTPITLTGTNFIVGATVTVGGSPAVGVILVDATTITCGTPAGASGAAAVTVTTSEGSDTLPGGFTYNSVPIITAVTPKPGSTAGGTAVTIQGANFQANSAGPNTVTIGGTPCTAISTFDDNTITCMTPPGAPGAADVIVTNSNGTDTLTGGFSYAAPLLYIAEGAGATATLASVDPVTMVITPIGPVGVSVTGMALAPDGTIYGAEAVQSPTAARRLLRIDPLTGTGTGIGVLADASSTNHVVPGMTFARGELIAVSGRGNQTLRINTTSGLLTLVGPTTAGTGGGLATDPATGTVYYGTSVAGVLQILDPSTGALTGGPALTGGTHTFLAAMAYLGGTLYAVDKAGGPGTPANLVSINTTTGAMTTIVPLPPSTNAIVNSIH